MTVTMTSKQKVFLIIFVLLGLICKCSSQNEALSEKLKNIFLTKTLKVNEYEWILESARKNYLLLKHVDHQSDVKEDLNFVNNYANFLLKLFKELQTDDIDIFQLFSKENNFFKNYNSSQNAGNFSVAELKSAIEDIQTVIERHLITHHNTSNEYHDPVEVLALNETNFNAFLKEQLRADHSEIGYFILEVFATLIGLSWGIISTVLHITRPMNE